MSRACREQLGDERGATIVVVALSLVMVIGFAAIAVDVGMLFSARSEAQRVADAAALAGASVFAEEDFPAEREVAEAEARAIEYGGLNQVRGASVQPGEMTIEVVQDEGLVRVTVTRLQVPTWFARIFGVTGVDVAARAAAAVQRSGTVECLRPMAFADLWHEVTGDANRYSGFLLNQPRCAWGESCDYYEPTATGRGMWWRNLGMPNVDGRGRYEAPAKPDDVGRRLRFDLNDNTGNFAAASTERLYRTRYYPLRTPGCNGGNCWRDGLAGDVCTGAISIGDIVVTEPGVQVGPTNQGFRDAFDDDPGARWDDATNRIVGSRYPLGCTGEACTGEGSRRIFNVAMVDPASRIVSNASDNFEIQNFGAFFLEEWRASGGDSWVQVRWMQPTAVADDCRTRGNCRNNLILPLRLVE
jgi:hypothetical protein